MKILHPCNGLEKLLVAKNHLLLVAKFPRYSLEKLLVAKNHSLLVAEFARCKKSLVTCCKICLLLVAEIAPCQKLPVTRYGKNPRTNGYLKPIKMGEFYLLILYFQLTKERQRFRIY